MTDENAYFRRALRRVVVRHAIMQRLVEVDGRRYFDDFAPYSDAERERRVELMMEKADE